MISINKLKNILGKPEYFFLTVSLIFGGLLYVVTPPFQTPDENIHFYRAYEVSEFKRPHVNKEGKSGSFLPLSIKQTELRTHGLYGQPGTQNQIQFNSQETYNIGYTKGALFDIPLNASVKEFYVTSGSPDYMPLSYTVQAFFVFLARAFESPILLQLYIVRLVNLLIWVTCAFIAIKIFPFKKWTLAGICLLPVAMSQSISPGLDVGIFSSTILFLAILIKALADKNYQFSFKTKLLLIFLSLIMVFGKSVLAVFLLLILLLPNKRISSSRGAGFKALVILLPVIMYILWTMIFSGTGASETDTMSRLQLSSLFDNPLIFISSLFHTFFFITPSGSLLNQSIVGNFGWLDTPVSPFVVSAGYIIIGFMLFVDYEKKTFLSLLDKKQRLLLTTVAVGYLIAVFLAMFIYFTMPSDNHIRGVNGRYFVPLLFLLIPLLSIGKIKMPKLSYVKFVQYSSVFLVVVSVLTIIYRYYYPFMFS